MPTRKQRRRQQKERRHEYEIVYVDDEGNEVEAEPDTKTSDDKPKSQSSGVRPTAKQPAQRAKQPGGKQPAGARAPRKIDPPSWGRVGRRAAIFAPIMVIVVYYLNRNAANPLRETVVSSVVLVLFFLPFSYFMDTVMYRQYRKRIGDPIPPRERKPPSN
ncbi:MAG TPA: hypothetical protein VLK53_07590 [Gaiellaceae bacterium]|nr:hypothetical protein [Gaiellaceae bacterium]